MEVIAEEANAKGYQEPDVEWHDLDERTLQRIVNDEEGVAGLRVTHEHVFAGGGEIDADQWAGENRVGNAVGDSQRLRKLEIRDFGEAMEEEEDEGEVVDPWLFDFFSGLARNRSIEHLAIVEYHREWNPIDIISPFFMHNRNLRCIEIHSCDLSVHFPSFLLALSACEKNQLEQILLYDNNLVGKQVTSIIKVLRGQHNLREIHLCGNQIFRSGCIELSRLLQHPHSKIHLLEIGDDAIGRQFINDESITIVTSALVVNSTIKVLDVSGKNVTSTGWRIFSSVICSPMCSLESLTLHGNDLDDESITIIGDSLEKSKTLKSLNLCCNSSITSAGWQGFTKCLRNPACALRELNVGMCSIGDAEANDIAGALAVNTSVRNLNMQSNIISDVGAIKIADALAVNSSLNILNMSRNRSITALGWVAFFNRLLGSTCSLNDLHIGWNEIDDQGAASLVNILASMSTLRYLELNPCDLITTNGWTVFAGALQTGSKVKTLDLGGSHFNDEAIISFATMLANNTSLSKLKIGGRQFSDRIWVAFSRVLCDCSCVQSTYLSNHTLHTLTICEGLFWFTPMVVPENLVRLLQMNTNEDKVILAREKIIAYHFSGSNVDIEAFAAIARPILPRAMEWIGRDLVGFSLMYHITRGIPALFE